MKASKEKTVVAAHEAKRRLDNPLTKAENTKKNSVEAERKLNIQRKADE